MLNPADRFNSDISAQEVFDHVVAHLASMTEPSKAIIPDYVVVMNEIYNNPDAQCAYRGDKGSMCAAGYLIADYEYSPFMEAKSFSTIQSGSVAVKRPERLQRHINLIQYLQTVHDQDVNWFGDKEEMKRAFHRVADNFNLERDIIREVKWVIPISR